MYSLILLAEKWDSRENHEIRFVSYFAMMSESWMMDLSTTWILCISDACLKWKQTLWMCAQPNVCTVHDRDRYTMQGIKHLLLHCVILHKKCIANLLLT